MSKDPAFLFYSTAWLEGTADMDPAEKGIYIDLLAHQHQKGFLPADEKRLAKLCGIGLNEFLSLWGHVKSKFVEIEPGKFVNKKLETVIEDRKELAHKNKIIGVFASLIRRSKISAEQKEKIKREFKVDDFLPFSTKEATERLTEWYYSRLPFLKDTITNTNTIKDNKGGVGDFEPVAGTVVGDMYRSWKAANPGGFVDPMEYQDLRLIAQKISAWIGVDIDNPTGVKRICERWDEVLSKIRSDPHLSKYSIQQVNKHFAAVSQFFYNGNNTSKSVSGNRRSAGLAALIQEGNERFKPGGNGDR